MAHPITQVGGAKNLTASGAICPSACQLLGFYVNSTNAGTLVIKDGGATGTAKSGTITPAIGYHKFPASIGSSGYATIGGTALDVTFFYASGV